MLIGWGGGDYALAYPYDSNSRVHGLGLQNIESQNYILGFPCGEGSQVLLAE